jgi:putative peptide zinc metalloprotease protein
VVEPGQPGAETPVEDEVSRPGETVDPKPSDGAGPAPKLAEGVELLGRYEDSGYKVAPYIARRADGQMIQLPAMLYAVAEEADGRHPVEEIAERVSRKTGRGVSPDNVRYLIDEKLRPLGVFTTADGSNPEVQKADPLLALKFRTAVIPKGVTNAITTVFRPLFFGPVILAVLGGLVALDVWLFGTHGVAQGFRDLLYKPVLLLAMLGIVTLSAAFHEIGHATACRYSGAEPGVMGVGLYIVWPAFYTDVTDAYRLDKRGRLRTDLGGIYFNAIFSIGVLGVYFLTHFEMLIAVAVLLQVEMLRQLQPFLRLDGYYIVSDLTGVPDLFARIKPILQSLLPWRRSDEAVTTLKRWVRVVVTIWVLMVIPILLFQLTVMVIAAPRLVATAWDSAQQQWSAATSAFTGGQPVQAAVSGLQLILLALPTLGMVLIFSRLGRRMGGGLWRGTKEHPLLRGLLVLAVAGVLAGVAVLWTSRDAYQPIKPGERWTVGDAVIAISEIPSGEPGLALSSGVLAEDPATPGPAPSSSPSAEPSPSASVEPSTEPSPSVSGEPSPTETVPPSPTPTGEPTPTGSATP